METSKDNLKRKLDRAYAHLAKWAKEVRRLEAERRRREKAVRHGR